MRTVPGLETILELNGEIIAFGNGNTAAFVAARVEPDARRPHGSSYSLTLHDRSGKRLIGFDNAHPIRPTRGPAGRKAQATDHLHRGATTRPYQFVDAATLLEDFWKEIESYVGDHDG